jgi:methylenetetrahydrofolate dehydrogenase (NADP+)/methenyltetrahydrofolate cyclohydrolase
MTIIDGKLTAQQLRTEIAAEVAEMVAAGQPAPHLVAILVGNNGASMTYVANKEKMCGECGFRSTVLRMPEETTEEQLLAEVERLNNDPEVDGFIVQLPLPKHIDEQRVIEAISPRKDVDGFTPINVGAMVLGLECFVPATPAGILELLKRYEIPTSGKKCVVIGRSNIVGLPVAKLLLDENATVTIAHSRTQNLAELTRQAEILVVAIGRPKFVQADMVSEGTVVIDVGVNRDPETGKLCGDVDYAAIEPKASVITPVPGGVGPMTITCLMENTVECFKRRFTK